MSVKKAYLILAFASVCVIALLYGVAPEWFAQTFFGLPQLGRDFAHILRAMAGLYLALGSFWLYAAFKPHLRNMAVVTTAIFAGGLAVGRVLSLALDGWPSPLLVLYLAIEVVLVPVAVWVFRRPE